MSRTPTAFEQAILEYVNQARMNPAGEFEVALGDAESDIARAVEYFGVDVEAFRTQMEAYDPVAPLAWNGALATAALTHTEGMIEQDSQSHRLEGEASLGERITEAGYTGWSNVGENIYAYTKNPLFGHAGFMIDWGYDDADFENGSLRDDWQTIGDGIQDAAGHRVSIMSANYTDIGIGVLAEEDSSTSVGPYVLTQNFGGTFASAPAQLLGVFIDDADGDDFYDIGEGRGGVTVTATGDAGIFTTTTWDSGGYQMELAAGEYTVVFSGVDGAEGSASYEITVGSENIKLDSEVADLRADPDTTPEPEEPEEPQEPVVEEPEVAETTFVLVDGATQGRDVLSGTGTGSERVEGLGGDDVLMGDGLMAAYFPEISSQVYRLYQATLGRAPDEGGHAAWTGRIALEGSDVLGVAQGFVNSPEFSARFGGLDNGEFVELLYDNVLGRAADATGLARWTGDLDAGVSRAQVVLGFSDSAEFINQTALDATSFANDSAPMSWSDDVYRLYQATLDRAPDLAGFENWAERLATGTSYEDVANGFVQSTEFMQTYDSLDSAGFVELLYTNVLDRAADDTGLANWTARLDGGMSRAQVVEGFAQSAEFQTATAQALADWVRAQGTDDVLVGGSGSNVLAGGLLSDTFVLETHTGADTILDLEAWDTLDLTAMGYSSDAAARSDFSQQGANVVFDNNAGMTVTLIDTQLALLTDDMILV